MPRQAPASSADIGGQRHRLLRRQHDLLAAVPNGRRHWPFQTQTRSPTREAGTPSPTRSISPAPSLCGMTRGKAILRVVPARPLTSDGLTPEVMQLDAHLAAARLRRLHVGDAQHLAGGTVLLVIGGAHGALRCHARTGGHPVNSDISSEIASDGPCWIIRLRMMTSPVQRDVQVRRFTSPGNTSNTCARASISANWAASAPVIQTCAPSLSSSA